jgi:GAF domain-containing protein/HAMP domain-containing protein
MSVAAIADQAHSEPLKRLGDEMVAGRRGVMELTDPLTNEDIFATYAPIEEIGWSIGLMIPRADLLGRVNDLRGTLLGLTVVSLLALGGISLLLGETVVRPLIRLTETARQVAAGDLHRVAAVERHDEIGILAVTFNAVTARLRELIGSLEAQVEARTAQLRASAGVGRAAASILEPDQLLREVVNLIAERFGFYYAAVFTLDETGAFAMLREGTGEAGRLLKERGHKLEVGGESMVGYVTAQRKPRVAMDAGAEAIRFANPLLPGTRSEIALPLVVGESVLGALDVQSTQAAAFDEASIAVLQSMADQIAVALSNAQSFESVQEALQSTTRMYVVGRTLFAATSRREAYVAMSQAWAALRDLDRFSILMMSEHDLNGNPTEYEIVAEWNVIDGMQLEPGTRCTPGGLPLLGLVESDKVVVAGAGDVRLSEAAHTALEKAGATAAVLIPIVNRGRFEGLMMAVSQQAVSIRENDVRFMQSVVEQFAVVLGSLRAGEETRAALARVELLNRQLSGEAWRNYLAPRMGGLAVESGQLELEQASSRVAAPVVVRGETLGMLELEDADAERQWSEDEWDLLNTVAGELALAIENARLIEQAQQRAAREAQLNQIAHKIRRATDVESILHVAAEELGLALDTSHANIRLGPQTALTRRRHGG